MFHYIGFTFGTLYLRHISIRLGSSLYHNSHLPSPTYVLHLTSAYTPGVSTIRASIRNSWASPQTMYILFLLLLLPYYFKY